MQLSFGPRRGEFLDISKEDDKSAPALSEENLAHFEAYDLLYRSLCALLYNFVPTSGHPGVAISSGRIVTSLLFGAMDYDVSDPDRDDADLISYAAGHKALGLYAMWALRNEVVRLGAPRMLPADRKYQLRLEDLLGFRRNPTTALPLFTMHRAKALDGHPTPATPFVRLATGASGVGLASSFGLALAARDFYGENAPRVHVIEGEGGLTPGRVAESLAAMGTARLDNLVVHLDWNQASIDSNRVCRDGDQPGDYVQWDPRELFYLHDWNLIEVPDGFDFRQIVAAQRRAGTFENHQPTAIVYRTVKGWQYGIEGRASHGAGHPLCSDGFYKALEPLGEERVELPSCCDQAEKRCAGSGGAIVMEDCFWAALHVIRHKLEGDRSLVHALAHRLLEAVDRLERRGRRPRTMAPVVEAVYEAADLQGEEIPDELKLEPGTRTTLRGELGRVLNYYNRTGSGAFFAAAADLLGSTSINKIAEGFPEGYFNAASNPKARLLSVGGICEDAMAGVMSGISAFGRHIGVASSYAAFMAPLGHIAARLHAIGNQARLALDREPYRPMILVCAHAGLKTGEDGPTHADPQALQLLQDNFPAHTCITLTPWDPRELWPLMSMALARRPAIIAPFVTRPTEVVPDRGKLGLRSVFHARNGVYLLHKAVGPGDGTLVLQGSEVAMAFVNEALPRLQREGVDLNIYYVASAELFDSLPAAERARAFPEERAVEAMGITGFTLPTLYRWVRSARGRRSSLHPFRKGHYLGSGRADMVLAEAGLDGESQYRAIRAYLDAKVHA